MRRRRIEIFQEDDDIYEEEKKSEAKSSVKMYL